MSLIKTKAVVLGGFRYGETSKIITLFTETAGKFAAVVKGVRNMKSRSGSVFENMNLIEVILNKKENRDLQFISKAECMNSFFKIKSDIEKLSAAYRMLELTGKTTYDYDPNSNIFQLLSETMKTLDETGTGAEILFLYFQIHLALHLGIDPLGKQFSDNSDNIIRVSERIHRDMSNLRISEYQEKILQSVANCNLGMLNVLKTDDETVKHLQEAYNLHFMMNLQRYGYLNSHKIFEQLKK